VFLQTTKVILRRTTNKSGISTFVNAYKFCKAAISDPQIRSARKKPLAKILRRAKYRAIVNDAFNHAKCKGHVKYEKTAILSRI
jgi:hypothetical protein